MSVPAPRQSTARVARVLARCSGVLALITGAATAAFALTVPEPRLIAAAVTAVLLGILSLWIPGAGGPRPQAIGSAPASLTALGWLCAATYVIGIVVPLLGFFVSIAIGLPDATPLAVILFTLGIVSAFSGLRILRVAMLRRQQLPPAAPTR